VPPSNANYSDLRAGKERRDFGKLFACRYDELEDKTAFAKFVSNANLESSTFFQVDLRDENASSSKSKWTAAYISQGQRFLIKVPEEIVPASKESLITLLELAELLGCQFAWVFLDRALPLLAERARVFAYIGFQMVPERYPNELRRFDLCCSVSNVVRVLFVLVVRTTVAHCSWTSLTIWTLRTLTTSSCATTFKACAA
jgi:hypothetical protein